ncbi:MAG: acyl-CoA thioesterase [Cyanothece sp. SIO1E1]|nr:acyl-CoA thioesterase [Cyanothece sp. SIO1E1]
METYRGLVMAQEVDSNGHMNVQFYTTKYDIASGQFMAKLGIDYQEQKRRKLGFVYVEMTIRYIKEVMEDDPIHIESIVRAVSRKVVSVEHQMKHSSTGELLSTALAKWVVFDQVERKAVMLEDAFRTQLEEMIQED